MEVQSSVSSWCVPLAISALARSSISSWVSGGSSSRGGGAALRLRLDFVLDDAEARFPKPREVAGALRRPVSIEVRPRSEMMLMLFIISSRRDCAGHGLVLGRKKR